MTSQKHTEENRGNGSRSVGPQQFGGHLHGPHRNRGPLRGSRKKYGEGYKEKQVGGLRVLSSVHQLSQPFAKHDQTQHVGHGGAGKNEGDAIDRTPKHHPLMIREARGRPRYQQESYGKNELRYRPYKILDRPQDRHIAHAGGGG